MDYKALFLKCFPAKSVWQEFILFRRQLKADRDRRKRIDEQIEKRRVKLLVATDDWEDEDWNDMTPEIWDKVKGG